LASLSFSQIRSYKPYWSASTQLSSSYFLSDLGGKNGNGTNDFLDLDLNKTRFSIGSAIHYNLPMGMSFGLGANYIRLAADDAETQSSRTPRMIRVFTNVTEIYAQVCYTLPKKTGYAAGIYFFGGSGIIHYQPKATWNGTTYNLRPLGTEGQTADPTREIYNDFSPLLAFGIGKKFYFYNGMSLAVDFNFRKSFTDYLDDVSTVYYDNNSILNSSGVAAAHFANPSSDPRMGREGNIRGNPDRNDNYFLIGCQFEFPLKQNRRRGRSNIFDAYGMHWLDKNGKKLN
jgi:hypothetical protein